MRSNLHSELETCLPVWSVECCWGINLAVLNDYPAKQSFLVWDFAWLDRMARVSHANHLGRHVFDDHRSGADHTQLSDGHSGSDEDIGRDPSISSNRNWWCEQGHGPLIEIVSAGTQMHVLTDIGTVL